MTCTNEIGALAHLGEVAAEVLKRYKVASLQQRHKLLLMLHVCKLWSAKPECNVEMLQVEVLEDLPPARTSLESRLRPRKSTLLTALVDPEERLPFVVVSVRFPPTCQWTAF